MIAVLVVGSGLCGAIYVVCPPMLGEFTPVSQRGAVIAIYGAIYTLAGIIAPMVMGSVIKHAATPMEGYMTGFTINAVDHGRVGIARPAAAVAEHRAREAAGSGGRAAEIRVSVMARYRLHCIGASGNSYKLALYMNCAGLDWEPVGVDFAGGETRDPNWRASTNAMGEVPVLEVDGQLMSQSGAILVWLAETTGQFAPAADQRYEALRWIMFDNHKFTNNHAMHRFQRSFMPEPVHPAVLAFLRARTQASFAIADKHLANRAFMLGDRPTIVDFSMAGYVFYPAGGNRLRHRGRIIRLSMPGASASPHCRAGSRPTT